jgi:hypothetical protein
MPSHLCDDVRSSTDEVLERSSNIHKRMPDFKGVWPTISSCEGYVPHRPQTCILLSQGGTSLVRSWRRSGIADDRHVRVMKVNNDSPILHGLHRIDRCWLQVQSYRHHANTCAQVSGITSRKAQRYQNEGPRVSINVSRTKHTESTSVCGDSRYRVPLT